MDRSTRAYEEALQARTAGDRPLTPAETEQLNAILIRTERALTRQEGLPRRP